MRIISRIGTRGKKIDTKIIDRVNTSGEKLSKLETIAETTTDLQQLAELAQHQTVPVRYAVMNNPMVTPAILQKLSEDGNSQIADTARRLLEGFMSSNGSSKEANSVKTKEPAKVTNFDFAAQNLEKLQARAGLFMGLTLTSLILGILIVFIAAGSGLSSYGGLFGSGAAGFFFLGIALLQLAFVFAVGYIFTSTMAQHAAVNYHLAYKSKR